MKIVITGGHFSPAYSVILELIKNNEILVIGRKNAFEGDSAVTFEYKTCQKLNIPFKEITTGRLQRRVSKQSIYSFIKFPKGIYSALKILKAFSPDVIVTFGGYIGLPVAIAGKILGIPVLLHEQTQKAGLSSRLIARFASKVMISFESSRQFFKRNDVILTGNPLRPEFFEKNSNNFPISSPSIYITGGSTGSHTINEAFEKILPSLLSKYQIFHQTGNSDEYNDFERLRMIKDKNYTVSEFFTPGQVFELLKNVDLVVARSGINTVTEIIASSAVALLIPIQIGQLNEQKDNAQLVKDLGIGEFILQKNLTPQLLLEKINVMMKIGRDYKKNFSSAQRYIHLDSTDKIIGIINLYGKRTQKGRAQESI